MKALEERLIARQDRGRYWWELTIVRLLPRFRASRRSCTRTSRWRPQFAYSEAPLYFVNTCYFWRDGGPLCSRCHELAPDVGVHVAQRAARKGRGSIACSTPSRRRCRLPNLRQPIRREVEEHVGALLELTRESQRRRPRAARLAAVGAGRSTARPTTGVLCRAVGGRFRLRGPQASSQRSGPTQPSEHHGADRHPPTLRHGATATCGQTAQPGASLIRSSDAGVPADGGRDRPAVANRSAAHAAAATGTGGSATTMGSDQPRQRGPSALPHN